MWQRGITAATAYHARHGHLQVPDEHTEPDGYRLGQFIVAQRMLHKRGTLTTDRVTALEALGIIWNSHDHRFTLGLAAARRYHHTHGHLNVTNTYQTSDGYQLGAWLKLQRVKFRNGTLTTERGHAPDAVSPTWRQR